MNRAVFLLEERSMKVLLEGLLPRLVPELPFLCVAHAGKQDLEKSIPRKLRAWKEPGVAFVVVRDKDQGDCKAVKKKLCELCREGGRPDTLVRIPCHELEAWYLGDPEALAKAYQTPRLLKMLEKEKRFADGDAVPKPSVELETLVPEFQKISGARRMAEVLSDQNRSHSFQVFIAGVRQLAAKLASAEAGSR
jgi:hypothetical protein